MIWLLLAAASLFMVAAIAYATWVGHQTDMRMSDEWLERRRRERR